ncbi:odorant receptor, family 60, subfamily A, member 1 [Diretmus argenteus]
MNQSFIHTAVLLTAYNPTGPLNYVFFTLTFFLYVFTVLANLILILVICMNSSLHKPMYVFLLNLAVNGLIGCSAVCPKVMDNLLRDIQSISYGGCLLQVLFINVYATCAYAILAVMAYDRYVSICKPLQYHIIVTPSKVKILSTVVYLVPVTLLSFQVYLTSRLPLCRFTINKLFCVNLAVVKLSCVKSTLANLYGLFITATLVVLPCFLVMLSYMKILQVSLRASKESQKKSLSTCASHLIVFINFSVSIIFSVVYNRHSTVSTLVNHLNSAQFIFFPPLLHPVVYGIRTKEIRRSIAKLIRRRTLARPT